MKLPTQLTEHRAAFAAGANIAIDNVCAETGMTRQEVFSLAASNAFALWRLRHHANRGNTALAVLWSSALIRTTIVVQARRTRVGFAAAAAAVAEPATTGDPFADIIKRTNDAAAAAAKRRI